jgi:hypothetical protein
MFKRNIRIVLRVLFVHFLWVATRTYSLFTSFEHLVMHTRSSIHPAYKSHYGFISSIIYFPASEHCARTMVIATTLLIPFTFANALIRFKKTKSMALARTRLSQGWLAFQRWHCVTVIHHSICSLVFVLLWHVVRYYIVMLMCCHNTYV